MGWCYLVVFELLRSYGLMGESGGEGDGEDIGNGMEEGRMEENNNG